MPRKNPDVTFIVPSYRSSGTIRSAIESIATQQTVLRAEIIIVDSSGPDTGLWLREQFPECQVIEAEGRLWAGAARNRGLRSARGEYVAFVDADAVLEPGWLQTMYETMRADPEIRLTGGWVGRGRAGTVFARALHWIEFSEFLPGMASEFRASLSTSNCLTKREILGKDPVFDETFPMSEDSILSLRLQPGIFFEGKTGIHHHGREEPGEVFRHLASLGFWSAVCRRRFHMQGSLPDAWRWLAFTLPAYRAPRIIRRALQASLREGLYCLAHLPVLVICLLVWAQGYYRGLGRAETKS